MRLLSLSLALPLTSAMDSKVRDFLLCSFSLHCLGMKVARERVTQSASSQCEFYSRSRPIIFDQFQSVPVLCYHLHSLLLFFLTIYLFIYSFIGNVQLMSPKLYACQHPYAFCAYKCSECAISVITQYMYMHIGF